MSERSIHRPGNRTPEQRERDKAVRERFQRERPTMEELVASGEYSPPIPQGEYLVRLQLAAAIRKSRTAQNLSLADVAQRSGIDEAALSSIENGLADNLTISTLDRIARSIGKELHFVLEDSSLPTS